MAEAKESHAATIARLKKKGIWLDDHKRNSQQSYYLVQQNIVFPPFTGVSVNMMPFVLGNIDTLPAECKPYWDIITQCYVDDNQEGQVCYLTIDESIVEAGKTQRRPHLHTDRGLFIPHPDDSPLLTADNVRPVEDAVQDDEDNDLTKSDKAKKYMSMRGRGMVYTGWGGRNREGGIFMASTVSNTCCLWDTLIERPGLLGDCEPYRPLLNHVRSINLAANELYWITDATPHESLPMKTTGQRQFFRLVMSEVGVWFEKHSTANPLGIKPGCHITKANKFEGLDAVDVEELFGDIKNAANDS